MFADKFYRMGKLIYRYRWWVSIFWLVLLLGCVPFLPRVMTPFKSIGFFAPNTESTIADKVLNKSVGYSYNRFIIMYESKNFFYTNPLFLNEMKNSLASLKNLSIKTEVIYPDTNSNQISNDKRKAYAVILFKNNQEINPEQLESFRKNIKKPRHLKVLIGGEPVFTDDTRKQTQVDLYKSEYISTPVAIITMLVVFGSVVAASLPIVLGGVGAILILMILYLVGQFCTLSVFTLNIALLLGLCLSLDYALFIISRFRDELKVSNDIANAIAVTQATAGKAVFFSGLAVFISLSALLFFPINILFSVGAGGLAAVTVAIAIALILLPAILGILHKKINLLPIKIFKERKDLTKKTLWKRVVVRIVHHRFIFFFLILGVLLLLSYPFLHIKIGISDFRILPKNLESRQVFDLFKSSFSESRLTPIIVVVKTKHGSILKEKNIKYLYDFAHKIKKDPRVESISSIVNTDPELTKSQYQMLYGGDQLQLNPGLKKLLKFTVNNNISVITIISKYPHDSQKTKELIKKLRDTELGHGLTILVTGTSANTLDVLSCIAKKFPYAFMWVLVFTYIVLLVLLRSIVLPLKAIIMTILSLSASYGALVFVFQYGYLHQLLHFEPQGMIDITLLIIIFCALFGFSMDYEVFLLSRIKEEYEQSHNTIKSIVYGIDHSSKIISSAAIIVILICCSFMSADILLVKAFGMGIAVAIFVDAFLIRTILVPSTMAILGRWNWYLPRWVDKILPKIFFHPH